MKNSAYSRKISDGATQARKIRQQLYVIQQCKSESLSAGGVVLPRPRENLMQIV